LKALSLENPKLDFSNRIVVMILIHPNDPLYKFLEEQT